jgi:hypothetical protein
MQGVLSEVVWDGAQMLWNSHHLVAEEIGAPEGVLLFDETGFVKQGKDSVGVAPSKHGGLQWHENATLLKSNPPVRTESCIQLGNPLDEA